MAAGQHACPRRRLPVGSAGPGAAAAPGVGLWPASGKGGPVLGEAPRLPFPPGPARVLCVPRAERAAWGVGSSLPGCRNC